MIDQGDDNEQRLQDIFRVLRNHVVRVSEEFGARLGVRLRAIAASQRNPEPTVLEVFGRTVLDATQLMLAPVTTRDDDSSAKTLEPTPPAASGHKEDDDGK